MAYDTSANIVVICLACVKSNTRNMQAIFFSFVLSIEMEVMVPGIPSGDSGTGNKNHCMTEATHVLQRKIIGKINAI